MTMQERPSPTTTVLRADQRHRTHYTVLARIVKPDAPDRLEGYFVVSNVHSTNQSTARLTALKETDPGKRLVEQCLEHPEWKVSVVAVANFDPHELVVEKPPPQPPPKIIC